MHDRIVTESHLLELTGLSQRAALRRHLRAARIRFHETNGRIWTTQEAINAPLIGREKQNKGPNFAAITAKRPS